MIISAIDLSRLAFVELAAAVRKPTSTQRPK
nr:MAG TPA: hypothetical protein [Caudoviricetes sp.]